MKIREATAGDSRVLANLEAHCFPDEPWNELALSAVQQSDFRHAFVLENEKNAPVGYAIVQEVLGEGEVERIGIDPDFRGQRLGRRLLAGVMALLNLTQCFLEVREDNLAAKSLYASLGFTICGRRCNYYTDGTDAIMMKWERVNNEEIK